MYLKTERKSDRHEQSVITSGKIVNNKKEKKKREKHAYRIIILNCL